MSINKDSDSTFVALKNETLKKFKQFTFDDAEMGKSLEYNLMVSAKLPLAEQERLAEELIARGSGINFIKWEAGSVLPEKGRAMEHMTSFDYGYKISAVRG